MSEFFFCRIDKNVGPLPVTLEELKTLVATGMLKSTDELKKDEPLQDWQPAANILPDLFTKTETAITSVEADQSSLFPMAKLVSTSVAADQPGPFPIAKLISTSMAADQASPYPTAKLISTSSNQPLAEKEPAHFRPGKPELRTIQPGHKPAKLKPCPDCGHIVALTAPMCPNCGAPQVASKKRRKLLYGTVVVGVSCLVLIAIGITLNTNKEVILTGQQIYDKALKSTVWINNPGMGSGSGILVNAKDKLILTNYHVVFQPAISSTKEGKLLHSFNDSLTQSDPRDARLKLPYKFYPVNLSHDKLYVIDMMSTEIDSYLLILNDKGQILAIDDDSGGNRNARIRFVPSYDGKFQVMATVFDGKFGNYTLKITEYYLDENSDSVAPFLLVNFPAYAAGKVIPEISHYLKINKDEQEKVKAKVVAWNKDKDLALLKLDFLPIGVKALPLARESGKPGQKVHSIGNPGGAGALWVYTSGTVRTGPFQKKWKSIGANGIVNHDAWVIETQSPTNPGDSGGPLINDNLELVAVTQGIDRASNSISLFVDVAEVKTFLGTHGFHWQEKGSSLPQN